MIERTDAELVRAARAGDRAAFGALVQRHRPALLRACRGSADAAQEAALHALTGLDGLREDAAFAAWLCGIGRNVARAQGRRERRSQRRGQPLIASAELDPVAEGAVPAPSVAEELRGRVLAAVAALPPGQRDAVALFYLADLSHAQIAARLGISVGAVKTRLHKARAALQARLADLRREPSPMPAPVPMRVADVRDTGTDEPYSSHVVFLEEEGGARRLPIWIGAAEGTQLALRLHDVDAPRPSTYRFAADLLAATGAELSEVRIVRLADHVFYGQARLAGGAEVDARPSDALNLALITGAPVLVEEAVLARAAEGEREIAEMLETALASPRDARAIAEEGRARIAELPR
jgi:RNA polymerase sigma factor (sigma-70 family)